MAFELRENTHLMFARGTLRLCSVLSPSSTRLFLSPSLPSPAKSIPTPFLLCRFHNSNTFLGKMAQKVVHHAFCHFCGTKYAEGSPFPRECSSCKRKVYPLSKYSLRKVTHHASSRRGTQRVTQGNLVA